MLVLVSQSSTVQLYLSLFIEAPLFLSIIISFFPVLVSVGVLLDLRILLISVAVCLLASVSAFVGQSLSVFDFVHQGFFVSFCLTLWSDIAWMLCILSRMQVF